MNTFYMPCEYGINRVYVIKEDGATGVKNITIPNEHVKKQRGDSKE